MDCVHIQARDIPDSWFQVIDTCYRRGRDYIITKGSYEGSKRRELDFVTIRIRHPCMQPRETRLPTIPPAYGIPDPIPGGVEYVDDYAQYILTPHIKENETYTYGSRLTGELAANDSARPQRSQMDEVIRRYKLCAAYDQKGRLDFLFALERVSRPVNDSIVDRCSACAENGVTKAAWDRHCIVDPATGAEMEALLCDEHGVRLGRAGAVKRNFATNQLSMTVAVPSDIHLNHSPCMREIGTRIYESSHEDGGKLNFVIHFRSWDAWSGYPVNLCGLADLMDYMAGEIGVEPGEFICTSQGLHLYDMYWPLAKIRLAESSLE